jgi:alkylresorcinol/alkylpyrone synthase
MRISSVGSALAEHYYDQDTLLAAFREHWAKRYFNMDRIEQLHRNVLVGGRHLSLPIEEYPKIETWGQANDHWIRVAQELGGKAVLKALGRAELLVDDVDAFFFTTVTGVATPSIDARLMNRLGLPADVKRLPLFGLGCLAGAAGVARAADYLKGHPEDVAVLLSVELCSLTLQREDLSVENLIASGLFGDGAAAAVLVGANRGGIGPRVVDSRSSFYTDTERVMGWDVSERGFKVVLSAEVPEMVRRYLRRDVEGFLAEHGLTIGDITVWVSHPGGPKVLEAMQEALDLPEASLDGAWRTLREVGNLSSTSVLLVLEEVLESQPPPGSWALMSAMGPGFCSELVLLRWDQGLAG